MNLHIQKLAEQAGMNIVDDKFSTYGKFAEKFAELIIAECIAAHEDDYGADIIGDVLKKHFGVEE
mgnify:CR=1 FL=1|tara:strand:- start:256 stop:450 length:195 start_codon:yes stop_codon:yes gene_type:complete